MAQVEAERRSGNSPTTQFRLDLQGLRAVAVLAVILYHARELLPGGFVGVDVFFVISGFVITQSLANEQARTGRIRLREFYVRRVRRLTPMLTVTLAAVVPLALLFGPGSTVDDAGRTALASSMLLANLYLAQAGGYFSDDAELNPLLHTWSLSLEEQFYLVLPALVAWLLWWRRRGAASALASGLVVASAASFVGGLALSSSDGLGPLSDQLVERLAFFSMPTRAWQFCLGGLLAVRRPRDRRTGQLLGSAGLVMMLGSFVFINDSMPYPGWIAGLPTLAALAVIAFPDHVAAPLFRHRAMVRLGDVSYSWYLWHWPAMVFARAAGIEAPVILGAVGLATLPLAMLTYRTVETRYQHARDGRPSWIKLTGLSVGVGVATFLLTTLASAGALVPAVEDAQASLQQHEDRRCDPDVAKGILNGCELVSPDDPSAFVVLYGDSNAGQFTEAIRTAAQERGWRMAVVTQSACPMTRVVVSNFGTEDELCTRQSHAGIEWLLQGGPDVVVIANASDLHLQLEGRTLAYGDLDGESAYQQALQDVISDLGDAGTQVLVAHPIPKFAVESGMLTGPERCSAVTIVTFPSTCSISMNRLDAQARRAGAVAVESAASGGRAHTIDVFGDLCPTSQCSELVDGIWSYRDPRHISVRASERLAGRFAEEINHVLTTATHRTQQRD